MAKIIDIKKSTQSSAVNLRTKSFIDYLKEKIGILKKEKNVLYKKETPIKEVKDLHGGKSPKYFYMKGKKFNPPKSLGNLVKIAGAGFLIIFLINALNVYFIGESIKEDVSSTASQGYNYLIDAGKSATKIQFENAVTSFDKAIKNFSEAENDFWFISKDISFYSKFSTVGRAASNLLEGGKHFASAGKYFLDAMEEFNKIPIYFVSKNTDKSTQPSITDTLGKGLDKTNLAIREISLSAQKIKNIDVNELPAKVVSRVSFAKQKIQEISSTLNATSKYFPALLKLLGDKHPHRYLILFQNNNEIRATGGFIGSYAIVDVNDGYIDKIEVQDVYDIDGSYWGIIEPPDEFKEFTSNWRFRDSNYSPDFSVSAKKIRWFLEKEGGPTVDTVIAINQGLLKDMLEITGPIQVGQFGKLNSENYNLLLSFVIESKAWGEDDPKHILKIFVPAFKEAILKKENISRVTSKLYKAIQQKHIMMYSSDDDIQSLFESIGVSGETHNVGSDEDYLSVINIATGGTKSEQFMREKINHDTYIDKYGNVVDEVTVLRSHLWSDKIYYQWKNILEKYGFKDMPDNIIDILGRGDNKVITRIYVPEGSIMLESDRNDVVTKYDKDLKKTYFFLKMNTSAGKTSEVKIKYRLPFVMKFNPAGTYKLVAEKQPGSLGSIFTKTVHADESLKNIDIYPSEVRTDDDKSLTYATNLVYDKYFAGVWEK